MYHTDFELANFLNVTSDNFHFTVEDLERHDGSPEKPYYMSKDLMKIVGKKNKKKKHDPDEEDIEEW